MTTFKDFSKANEYIRELGYVLKGKDCVKEDKSFIYKHRQSKRYIYLKSSFDFVDAGSMDKCVRWTIQKF